MRMIKRTLILVLALILVCFGVGCKAKGNYFYKNNSSEYVMKYGDYSINKNFYTYWMARYKAVLMYQYSDIQDTASFWDSAYGEGTANEIYTAYSDETMKNYLMSMYLFDFYKLSLSEAQIQAVDKQLSEIVSDGYEGNVANLNKEAYEYGINYEMLREIYLAEAKTEVVYNYVIKNVVSSKLTEEVRDSYLASNYAHTTHIFVSTEYKYNTDKDGNLIYDDNGKYTIDLTEAEKKEKDKIIAELDAASLNSVNFSEYQKKYNDDIAIDKYKNGYFVSTNIDFDSAYVTAALTMKEGEIKRVEGENGVFYILKQSMPDKAYSDKDNEDFFVEYDSTVQEYLYWEFMAGLYTKIEINTENKKDITVKSVSPCWYF